MSMKAAKCPACASGAVGPQPHPGGPPRMACANCGYASISSEFRGVPCAPEEKIAEGGRHAEAIS